MTGVQTCALPISSRIAEMTRREVSAFALRVLNTSAAVTESECGRQES